MKFNKSNKEFIGYVIIALLVSTILFMSNFTIASIIVIIAITLHVFVKILKKHIISNLEPINDTKYIDSSFPIAHAKDGKIIYYNESFLNKIGIDKIQKLEEIDFSLQKQIYKLNNEKYTVYSNAVNDYIELSFLPYIIDKKDDLETHISVTPGLIFIDNFEEAMETVEEIRRPLTLALIDRKINSLIHDIGGIVKKFEKDRYIVLFSTQKLEYLKENNFDILKQIREIDMGNTIPFTLSIGIGKNGNSLHQSMEYARAAIDLALGRSGDQVVIKDSENYYFYGGKASDVVTNTRVRARVKAYVLTDLIQESENVVIMGHKNADLDSLGACIGVHNIACSLGKKSNIVLNNIPGNIKGLYDKLVEVDKYKEGCFITGEEAIKVVSEQSLLIITDCHKPSILEFPPLLEKTKKIVVFDHHRKGAEFIKDLVLTYHEPYASSTCELITEMIQYVKYKVNLMPIEADALLSGISLDTKNFAIKTGARTFEAAAYLRRNGADTVRVKMLMQNDMETYKAKSQAINAAKIFKETIAITYCPSNVENPSLVAAQTADELLNIVGIETSFACCNDKESNKVVLSARSLGEINVQRIMEKLGGGGHQTVAGAQFRNLDEEAVIKKLEIAIEEYLEEMK